jgi:very-short-patch-repair endonuclease
MAWKQRLSQNPSTIELLLAERLQKDKIRYRTQEPLWVSSADFYFETRTRPLVVFIDGPPHLDMAQALKDDIYRRAIRRAGYHVLELAYKSPSDKVVEEFYNQIQAELARLGQV